MSLGPFLFGAPLALLGLIALPVIWYILRATPPAPQEAALPSLRLLDDVEPEDETPARTPWWILLLRLLAAAAAILGLSNPVYAPGAQVGSEDAGPALIVIDNGWTSTPRWGELQSAASSALDGASRDTAGHLLLTAPRTLNADPADRLTRTDLSARIGSLDPVSWGTDREDALERLEASGIQPARILWASDGLGSEDARAFADALGEIAPLSIYAAAPRGPFAITGLSSAADGAAVTVRRVDTSNSAQTYVSALTLDGAALATAEADFPAGEAEAIARFDVPAAALARVERFAITGVQGAGSVWLWDSADRSRRVGLVSGDSTAQPLLSDMHYVRQALEPFAHITDGSIEELIAADPDAIIMTDIGQLAPELEENMAEWVDGGGALIRFAGPRLAAQSDSLVPTPLRRSSRAIGGALTWEDPQSIGSYPETSPFAGLSSPADIKIRQQVLARPDPELASRTWARLQDGSPLVTGASRGQGTLVLFHVTAGPDWSDLPYSGIFVEMLRRAIAAGRGETMQDEEGTYTPEVTVNGYGRLVSPGPNASPIAAADLADAVPSESHPPGLYRGPGGTRAINTAAAGVPALVTNWPTSATLLGDAEAQTIRLGGLLLGLAGLLIAIDLLVALALAGRFPSLRRGAHAALLIAGAATLAPLAQPPAHAQFDDISPNPYSYAISPGYRGTEIEQNGEIDKAMEALLEMRLAYIETGDSEVDAVTRAGLRGLSLTLFRRTSVEPAEPHTVDPETDELDVYPMIVLALPDNATPLSSRAVERLNAYLRNGGAFFIDTRRGGNVASNNSFADLDRVLPGLDTPPLQPVSQDHVMTRSFYLIDGFAGRYQDRQLWIESSAGAADASARRGDGVSGLIIGDADYLAAWAIDESGRPLLSVDGGDREREMARRFGVNLMMYVLTGNYKEDQVHIPALLERLGEGEDGAEPASTGIERQIPPRLPGSEDQEDMPDIQEMLRRQQEGTPE